MPYYTKFGEIRVKEIILSLYAKFYGFLWFIICLLEGTTDRIKKSGVEVDPIVIELLCLVKYTVLQVLLRSEIIRDVSCFRAEIEAGSRLFRVTGQGIEEKNSKQAP